MSKKQIAFWGANTEIAKLNATISDLNTSTSYPFTTTVYTAPSDQDQASSMLLAMLQNQTVLVGLSANTQDNFAIPTDVDYLNGTTLRFANVGQYDFTISYGSTGPIGKPKPTIIGTCSAQTMLSFVWLSALSNWFSIDGISPSRPLSIDANVVTNLNVIPVKII